MEQLFSHGGLNITKRWHNLSTELTIDQTVLNSWFKCPGLVPQDLVSAYFNDKHKWPNNGGKSRHAAEGTTSSEIIVLDRD